MPRLLLALGLALGLSACTRPSTGTAPLDGTWLRLDDATGRVQADPFRYTFAGDSLALGLPEALGGDTLHFGYRLDADTLLVLDDATAYRIRLAGDTLHLTEPDGPTSAFLRQP